MSPIEQSRQALRADAERNRRLILDAAYQAFGDEGLEVSLTEIARRAGVGFATLQRRFPTKDALVTEVVRAQLAHIGENTARAGSSDPWEAFSSPILDCCAHQIKDPGLAGALAQLLSATSRPAVREPLLEALGPLAERAIADGAIQHDVTIDDVVLILKGNAGVITNSPGHEAKASQRFVEVALRGLRNHSP